jgi:hypothetical protein
MMNKAEDFIKEFGADEFRPFAYYDKHLDCIRVRLSDCSMSEERKNRIFTLVKAAHSEKLVGFNIKGICHLFKELGLEPKDVYLIIKIIDEIVKHHPDTVGKLLQEHEEWKNIAEDQGEYARAAEMGYDILRKENEKLKDTLKKIASKKETIVNSRSPSEIGYAGYLATRMAKSALGDEDE